MLESTLIHNISPEALKTMFAELHAKIDQIDAKTEEKYFTREQVSKMFNVDNSTLHNWNKTGVLKSNKLGGKVVYKLSEIEKAIK